MPLSIGDATMRFLADTTELDRAFDKAGSDAKTKLQPVQQEVSKVGAAMDQVGQKGQAAWDRVAQAALKNTQAQTNLRSAMDDSIRVANGYAGPVRNLADAQLQATASARELAVAQKEAAQAAGLANASYKESNAALGLTGELMGVHIPRHLRSFVSSLPGVKTAMEFAFSAVAVVFLLDIISELPEKISKVEDAITGWGDAARQSYDDVVKLNNATIDHLSQMTIETRHLNEASLEGSTKTRAEIANLKADLKQVSEEYQKSNEHILQLNLTLEKSVKTLGKDYKDAFLGGLASIVPGLDAWLAYRKKGEQSITEEQKRQSEESIKVAKEEAQKKKEEADKLALEIQRKEAELHKAAIAEYIRTETAKVNAVQKLRLAEIDLRVADAKLDLAQHRANAQSLVDVERKAEADRYTITLTAMREKLRLLEMDPTRNKETIITLNGEIVALEKAHQTQMVAAQADGLIRQQKITDLIIADHERLKKEFEKGMGIINTIPSLVPNFTDDQRRIQVMMDLLKALGVDYVAYAEKAGKAEADLAAIEALANKDSLADQLAINMAKRTAIQATIDYKEALGQATSKEESQLKAINAQLERMGVNLSKDLTLHRQWADFWRGPGKSLGDIGKKAFLDLANGIGSAVQAAALGADGIGMAMRKMLASILAGIAGEATVQAIKQLAMGFSDLADPLMAWHAPLHFKAAAVWGAVAVAAGVGASMVNPGTPSSGGSGVVDNPVAADGAGRGTSTGSGSSGSSGGGSTDPSPNTFIHRFAAGGLVTRRTLAMIGDDRSGSGDSAEGIMPLDNPEAMQKIGGAIAAAGGSPTVNNHFHINGLISADTLHSFIRQVNRGVSRGDIHLISTTSFRAQRRS